MPEITPVTTPKPVVVAVLVTMAVELPVITALTAPAGMPEGLLEQDGVLVTVTVTVAGAAGYEESREHAPS